MLEHTYNIFYNTKQHNMTQNIVIIHQTRLYPYTSTQQDKNNIVIIQNNIIRHKTT